MKFSKRKYRKSASKPRKTRKYARKSTKRTVFARNVMSVVNRKAETKEYFQARASNFNVLHNTVHNITPNLFDIPLGVYGSSISSAYPTRVGKKIFVKGIKLAYLIESQQYRMDATYWVAILAGKNTLTTGVLDAYAEVFEGVSTRIPMDYIDTDKVKVIYIKKMNIKMPASGTYTTIDAHGLAPEGTETTNEVYTNPKKMGKIWVPVNKTIHYLDQTTNDAASSIPSGTDRFQLVIWSFDNFSSTTGDATYPVGHLSISSKVYFTDV